MKFKPGKEIPKWLLLYEPECSDLTKLYPRTLRQFTCVPTNQAGIFEKLERMVDNGDRQNDIDFLKRKIR